MFLVAWEIEGSRCVSCGMGSRSRCVSCGMGSLTVGVVFDGVWGFRETNCVLLGLSEQLYCRVVCYRP